MTKIVYIAHPIGGDVGGNLSDLKRILRIINMDAVPLQFDFSKVVPCAPYFADCVSMDDASVFERARGMRNNETLIKTGVFDELWLTGNLISLGMREEIGWFKLMGKPIINLIGKL